MSALGGVAAEGTGGRVVEAGKYREQVFRREMTVWWWYSRC